MKHLVLLLLCSFAVAQKNKIDGPSNSGKPDLIFVLNQASQEVLEIVDQVSEFVANLEKEQLFSRYILIPFGSEKDIKETVANATSLLVGLDNNSPDRNTGSPCTDNSLTQIKRALDIGKPNSVILVFTDATQKDANVEEIKSRVRANHTQIFTFSSLKKVVCQPEPKIYADLGLINNGQFLETSYNNISDVLKIVGESLKPNRVQLLAIDNGTKAFYEIPVDASMRNFSITASRSAGDFRNSTMNITDQDDKVFCESVVAPNFYTCNKELSVKKLKISLNRSSLYSLRISAVSNFSYKFGFEDLNDTVEKVYSEPIKNISNTFILQMTGASKIKPSFAMTTVDGSNIYGPVPLTLAKNMVDVYYCTFKPSEEQFRVKISGTAANNNEFQFMLPVTFKSSDKSNNNAGANGLKYIKQEALVDPTSNSTGQNPVTTTPISSTLTPSPTTSQVTTKPTIITTTHKPSSSGSHHSASLILASLSVLTVVISAIHN